MAVVSHEGLARGRSARFRGSRLSLVSLVSIVKRDLFFKQTKRTTDPLRHRTTRADDKILVKTENFIPRQTIVKIPDEQQAIMTTGPIVKNPMYALCLLAAVCVRQYVQTRNEQPLTKGLSVQPPTAVFTRPNETILKSVVKDNITVKSFKKRPQIHEAESLVTCVQNFYKRACQVVHDVGSGVPASKTPDSHDLNNTNNVLDSILYLTSSVGTKWIA
ncbi:uncharacterized protein LOC143362659 [Halictus rubicundus]|uniref:uncharacterized protein LOC143362659 n=1 Tax=Halictus rubicundus TaxID=77578 RepID=UPI004036C319